MKLTLTTTETVLFTEEEKGALIAKIELTKVPLFFNGYDLKLTIAQGDGEPKETKALAFSKPHLPRNRGKVADVDGLTTVGQEDAPFE